jgi:hypothetical protein
MWDDRAFADAEVVCKDRSFAVHRNVLSAASQRFNSAFSASAQARIVIDDVDADSVEAFLKYIYKGEEPQQFAVQVLPLANQFELPTLMKVCGENMLASLSPQTVAGVVQALQNVRHNSSMQGVWLQVQSKVSTDPALVEALMMHVQVNTDRPGGF